MDAKFMEGGRFYGRFSRKKKIPQIKDFLNELFVKDFFQQQNHRRALSLSGFKILRCEINPLKIGNSKGAIEFILQARRWQKKGSKQVSPI